MDVTSLMLVPLTLYSDQLIKLELSCAKEPWEKLLCNADKNLFSFKLRILCFLFLQGVVMWCKTSHQEELIRKPQLISSMLVIILGILSTQ